MRSENDNRLDHQNLRTVAQLVAETSWLTEGKIRWFLFHRDTNGLAAAVVRIGGRLYIDLDKFQAWLADQRLAA